MNLRASTACLAAVAGVALATSALAGNAGTPPKLTASQPPPIVLPQVRIDHLDVTAWPKVRILATVLDGRGAPVELKKILRVDVLDGTKKATTASKQNPALVTFDKGVALDNRKDAQLAPRAEAGVGLDLVVVTQGYAAGIEAVKQQRLRDAVAAVFKPLGKGDRVNVLWYGDRISTSTGVKNLDGRLVDLENADVRSKCAEARQQARSLGPIDLAASRGKDDPPIPPGTDLCGLQEDAAKVAAQAKSAQFEGAFPRLFNLGPPFWDLSRYCATPPGALGGFGPFTKAEYEPERQKREDAKQRGDVVDFETSALDEALQLMLRDGREDAHKAIVLLSDGRDGWVWDLPTCTEHPPPPCNAFDLSTPENVARLAVLGEREMLRERHQLSVKLRACVEKNQVLTQRVALMQRLFHDKAAQWIGLSRALGVRIYAVGIRRNGIASSGLDLERLRLLAEKTGGTYREVDEQQPAIVAVNRTMSEVTGGLAVTFTHPRADEVEGAFAARLAVRLDPKLEHPDNPGTQLASDAVRASLPEAVGSWQRLKGWGWSQLVKLQLLLGYETYVIVGWVLAGLVSLLVLWLTVRLVRRMLRGPAATGAKP